MPEVEFAGADLHGELRGVTAKVSFNRPSRSGCAPHTPDAKLSTDHAG